jgi:hypothetical protein
VAARIGSLQPADPRIRRALHLGIAILVVLSVALAVLAALGDLPDVGWRFRPLDVGMAVAGFGSCLLLHAEFWRRILGQLGPQLAPRRSMAIWFTSGLGRYVPTSVLLPVLRAAMAERAGVPKRICLASVVYEAAFNFTAALIVGAYFVISLPELGDAPGRYLVLALPVIALILLQPRAFHPIADRVLVRLGREKLPLSLSGLQVLAYVALYAVTYLIAGFSVYALAQLVYPVGGGDLVVVVGAFAVGMAVSLLAIFLPGGVFVRDLGLALALSPVMPAAPAIAVAALARITQLGLELLGALVSPLLARSERPRVGG